jgi:hypothetical protein
MLRIISPRIRIGGCELLLRERLWLFDAGGRLLRTKLYLGCGCAAARNVCAAWTPLRLPLVSSGFAQGRLRSGGCPYICRCGAWVSVVLRRFVLCGRGIVGNFLDHVVGVGVEADAAHVFDGNVKGAEDEFGAAEIDAVARERVDDFHERGLERLFVFDEGDRMEAGLRGCADAADHALMEVAELLSAKSGRAATDSGDLDVRARFNVGMDWHIPTCSFLIFDLCKILVSLELGAEDMTMSAQNPGESGVASKILRMMDLIPAAVWEIVGMDSQNGTGEFLSKGWMSQGKRFWGVGLWKKSIRLVLRKRRRYLMIFTNEQFGELLFRCHFCCVSGAWVRSLDQSLL